MEVIAYRKKYNVVALVMLICGFALLGIGIAILVCCSEIAFSAILLLLGVVNIVLGLITAVRFYRIPFVMIERCGDDLVFYGGHSQCSISEIERASVITQASFSANPKYGILSLQFTLKSGKATLNFAFVNDVVIAAEKINGLKWKEEF